MIFDMLHSTTRDPDAINVALFEEQCKAMHMIHGDTDDSIMVFADNLQVLNSTKKYVLFQSCQTF